MNNEFGIFICFSIFIVLSDSKGVVLIIGGDTGVQFGVYNNTDVRTPNVDQLASNGVLFKSAFSSSLSGGSSSRSEILTGLPAHQNGMFGPHSHPSNFRSYDEILAVSKILSVEGVATGIIGVNGVGPDSVYQYDFRQTEGVNDEVNIGRNITLVNTHLQEFLALHKLENFFLVISLGDAERCADQQYGQFCENFGDAAKQTDEIPDWKPATYNFSKLKVPYYVPDLDESKVELANLYRSIDRLDQGIGLYMSSLVNAGLFSSTLVIFTSTGGIAFPGAKYNSLDSGSRIPLIIGSGGYSTGKVSEALVSSLDIVPTILDYFGLPFPKYSVGGKQVIPSGQSLIPQLIDPTRSGRSEVFSTQNFFLINEDFPIRAIRNGTYKLIWNKWETFPIVQEIFNSPTFIRLVNQTKNGEHSYWWTELTNYLHRSHYELYDLTSDPYEVSNVSKEPRFKEILEELQSQLNEWQRLTSDPWLCPGGFLNIEGNCTSYL